MVAYWRSKLTVTPRRSMLVMLFFSSLKHALNRFASSFDIPCETSCFSKALLAFRTLHPRVKYIQKRLMPIRARCGVALNNVLTIDGTLISTSSQQRKRRGKDYSFSSSPLSLLRFSSFSRMLLSISSPMPSPLLSPCLPPPTPLSMSPMLVKVRM